MARKLTIFDTIERLERKFEHNPTLKLVSSTECQDLALECDLKAVPVEEETPVEWYFVDEVKAAIAAFREKQAEILALRKLTRSDSSEPTPVMESVKPREKVSLEEAGVFDSPHIDEPEPQPDEPETAQTVIAPKPDAYVKDDKEPTPAPTMDGQAAGLVALGLDSQTVAILEAADVRTESALRKLVEAGGMDEIRAIDGIAAGRAKKIETALGLTTA